MSTIQSQTVASPAIAAMSAAVQSHLRRGAFEFRHLVLPEPVVFPEHHHERSHLIMVYGGRWQDASRHRRIELGAGELLFHPARFDHATGALEPGTELVLLQVDEEMTRAFCPLYGNVARDVHLPFEVLRGAPDRIREELAHGDEAAQVILEALAMQMLALGSRTSGDGSSLPPPWLAKALHYIRQAVTTPLTVQSIAAHVGVSASRLSHVFRDVMGRPVSAYILECRVRVAAAALRETSDPIGEVALACGFYDQAHLTRAFRSLRNMTPLEYRRSHQSRNQQQ